MLFIENLESQRAEFASLAPSSAIIIVDNTPTFHNCITPCGNRSSCFCGKLTLRNSWVPFFLFTWMHCAGMLPMCHSCGTEVPSPLWKRGKHLTNWAGIKFCSWIFSYISASLYLTMNQQHWITADLGVPISRWTWRSGIRTDLPWGLIDFLKKICCGPMFPS